MANKPKKTAEEQIGAQQTPETDYDEVLAALEEAADTDFVTAGAAGGPSDPAVWPQPDAEKGSELRGVWLRKEKVGQNLVHTILDTERAERKVHGTRTTKSLNNLPGGTPVRLRYNGVRTTPRSGPGGGETSTQDIGVSVFLKK